MERLRHDDELYISSDLVKPPTSKSHVFPFTSRLTKTYLVQEKMISVQHHQESQRAMYLVAKVAMSCELGLIHIDSSSNHVSAAAPGVHHSQAMVMLILGLTLVLTQTNGNLLNNLLCELGQLCREPEFAKCYFDESFVVPSLLISLVFSFSHPVC
ncbi:hypothetical protein VNO77_07226 [Canavalia gladiata]|uniref:Uncharacterized protein n=1 Tax=Canavalia gladiata TaxID=3824 RepID=A0AAN9QWI7_CANGL